MSGLSFKIFYVYFMDTKLFLKEGEQTKITENIAQIASGFTLEGFDLIIQITKWIHQHLKSDQNKERKAEIFRKRTADQIIADGFITGCSDIALVFIALARAKNIPTKYVEAIRRKWIESGKEDAIEGHIFAEIYFNNQWRIIDPTEACLKFWYDRYVIYAKGLDSWDIGISGLSELRQKFIDFRNQLLKNNIKRDQ